MQQLRNVLNDDLFSSYLLSKPEPQQGHEEHMFDPSEETYTLLRDWCMYRHLPISTNLSSMQKTVRQDLYEHHNYPSMKNFVCFQISDASDNFLINWLAWYGIKSDSSDCRLLSTRLLRNFALPVFSSVESNLQRLLDFEDQLMNLTNLVVDIHLLLHQLPPSVLQKDISLEKKKVSKQQLLQDRRSKQFLAFLLGASTYAMTRIGNRFNSVQEVRATEQSPSGAGVVQPIIPVATVVPEQKENKILKGIKRRTEMLAIPIVLTHLINKLGPSVPQKIQQAYFKDIQSKAIVPTNLIATQLDNSFISTIIREILLPSLND